MPFFQMVPCIYCQNFVNLGKLTAGGDKKIKVSLINAKVNQSQKLN